jgi:hypothetical protein
VTQAAKQLALPPNQNGYRAFACTLGFSFVCRTSDIFTADMIVIDLVRAFRVARVAIEEKRRGGGGREEGELLTERVKLNVD